MLRQREQHIDDETLSLYLDRRLDEATRERVESHLRTCEACRDTFEALRQTVYLLRHAPRLAPPRAFTLSEEEVQRPARARLAWGWTRWASAVVAALLVLTVGLDVFLQSRSLRSTPPAVEATPVVTEVVKEAELRTEAVIPPTPMFKSLGVSPQGQPETPTLTATPMPTPAPSPTPLPRPAGEQEFPPGQPAPTPFQWPWYRWLEVILAATLATLILLGRRKPS